jgi:hypothetical protein
MRLLAPPPTMKPTPPAIASEVRGSSFIYSPMSRLRRRCRSTSLVPVELFTPCARLGDFPNDLRDDIADRKRGRDCKPWLTTHELAQVEVKSAVLGVLLRGVVAVLDNRAGFVRCLTALIHRSFDGGVCGIFECHFNYLFERLSTEKVGEHRGRGESPGCPPFSPIPARRERRLVAGRLIAVWPFGWIISMRES